MSPIWLAVAGIGALVLALVGSRRALKRSDHTLRENYAGRPVPVVLGQVLVSSANSALLLALGLALLAGPVPAWPVPAVLCVGTYLLLFVGGLDDRSPHGARGLIAHLRELARGHATTGIWKLAAGVGLSIVLAAQLGGGFGRVLLSVVVIALSINVTNAMDVRPGRALKWAGLFLLPVSFFALSSSLEVGLSLAYVAYIWAGVGLLHFDLGERGMLGDAGSNPLGLVLGTSLAGFLPLWGLVVTLSILLGLQLAAETVTISRLIEAVPPLRWFDRLGQRS